MTEDELEELLWRIDGMAHSESLTDWERGFCQAMTKLGKRRNWRPSKRQIEVMNGIIAGRQGGQRQLLLIEE